MDNENIIWSHYLNWSWKRHGYEHVTFVNENAWYTFAQDTAHIYLEELDKVCHVNAFWHYSSAEF